MTTKVTKRYLLNQSALYHCTSKRKLARVLQIDLKRLVGIVGDIPNQYSTFTRPKKDSGERIVHNAHFELKRVQRRLFTLLRRVKRPNWLISGEIGKSITDNVRPHLGGTQLLKIDISGFFDNCSRESVYQFFHVQMAQPSDVAKICTDLCTLENAVVQGASTSMLIAFYANQPMLQELHELAEDNSLIFTVYVDDIAFSSSHSFQASDILDQATRIVSAYGFRVKNKKVRAYNDSKPKLLTGVIITTTSKMAVPNCKRRKILDDMTQYRRSTNPAERRSMRSKILGQISAAQQIEPDFFTGVKNQLKYEMRMDED